MDKLSVEELKDALIKLSERNKKLEQELKSAKGNRKYNPTLGELIDRLNITQLKEFLITEHRSKYSDEIKDIIHDIDVVLKEDNVVIDARMIRAIIVLVIANREIWLNESKARSGSKEGNDLYFSHSMNCVRNMAKNMIQDKIDGRKDYKLDNVDAYPQWIPSWDEN